MFNWPMFPIDSHSFVNALFKWYSLEFRSVKFAGYSINMHTLHYFIYSMRCVRHCCPWKCDIECFVIYCWSLLQTIYCSKWMTSTKFSNICSYYSEDFLYKWNNPISITNPTTTLIHTAPILKLTWSVI